MNTNPIMFSRTLFVCFALYLTALFASNTLGLKLMPFVFGTHLSVAVFFFPIVFLMTDLIGEVYGKQYAKIFVLGGIITTIGFLLMNILSNILPWSSDALWVKDSYNTIFGISFRMSLASVVAFALAEYQDVFAFFLTKKYFGEKFLWLRSLISNIWSQLLDTVIWTTIAFLGTYDIGTMIGMIIPWWIYKVGMGALYTPFLYWGKSVLTKFKNRDDHESQNLPNTNIS